MDEDAYPAKPSFPALRIQKTGLPSVGWKGTSVSLPQSEQTTLCIVLGPPYEPRLIRPSTPPIIRDTLPVPLLGYRPSEDEPRAEIALLLGARQTSSRGRHAFSVPPQRRHDSSLWQTT